MSRSLFGTDGVRGAANTHPMTAELALRLGAAAGRYFRRDGASGHRVVVGKDTRQSGYMFETALTAGFTSTGMNVLLLGPIPTPAVALLTQSMRADVGVMISASHNPADDNGIKFFGPDGFKLSDDAEAEIESILAGEIALAQAENIGRARRIDDGQGRYIERAKRAFPQDLRLDGIKVVIDCANGAAYKVAPAVLWELGAEVIPLGVSPNGRNINSNCGSTSPQSAAEAVVAHGADIGICLDGDADRVILLDEHGHVADGDQIMALFASRWSADGRLKDGTLVATVMSNLGLERYLEGAGLSLVRTPVGDRYVVEAMRQGGWNLGGEQSGHIVMTDYGTTGDGLMAALQFLAEMVRREAPASELVKSFETVPQLLKNVRFSPGATPLETSSVKKAVAEAEAALTGKGRLLIRKSGTEPLVRVMAECEDSALLGQVVDDVVRAVEGAA
ncbi:MAG: phosphoglucosamine mutase [Dinoroseobacter sp.]|nr:phosphoglucosamine mutase [Dinoroseobacter sp.]